jgi:MoaA/NifB/PqqE/SkfB family radical SAM enzyme
MEINKVDTGASGLWRRIRFHLYRGSGHQLSYLWNRVRWHIYPRLHRAGSYPDHVDIELSSACNMVCPMCFTVTATFKKEVPHKEMDFALFCKIVDELAAHNVYSIRLSWRGEPTLNKHYIECIRYAKQKGIKEVDSLTNALRLTPEMFEEMVDLKMDWLTISFDGTGETYEKIRKPAKYPEMVEKIRRFSEIKKSRNSVKPVVRLQGVWPAIAENPAEYFDTFEKIVDEISVNNLLDYLHVDKDIQYIENFVCAIPFQRLAIGSDGRAFMCINDDMGREPVGDAKVQTVGQIWNGKALTAVREAHIKHKGYETFKACKECYEPRKTKKVAYKIHDRTIFLDELVGRPQTLGK